MVFWQTHPGLYINSIRYPNLLFYFVYNIQHLLSVLFIMLCKTMQQNRMILNSCTCMLQLTLKQGNHHLWGSTCPFILHHWANPYSGSCGRNGKIIKSLAIAPGWCLAPSEHDTHASMMELTFPVSPFLPCLCSPLLPWIISWLSRERSGMSLHWDCCSGC